MNNNYVTQKEKYLQRIDVKTCENMLYEIVFNGTNCSRFESERIVDKVREVFLLNEHSEVGGLKPGQMKKLVINSKEPAGKKLTDCSFTHVLITFDGGEEDTEVYKEKGIDALRRHRILRICDEARQQGGLFTQEDLALLFGCDVRTIRRDISNFKKDGVHVPTRGHQKDIGPTLSHREQAIRHFMDNKEPLEVARQIKHSLKAVERYINIFCRVVFLYTKKFNPLQISFTIGISYQLTKTCIQLYNEYRNKAEYKDRLLEVENRALPFFEAIDSLKKTLPSERRKI
jgi:hypothetical protein